MQQRKKKFTLGKEFGLYKKEYKKQYKNIK